MATTAMTLSGFLLARIAEDARTARAVIEDQRDNVHDPELDGEFLGTGWSNSTGWEHNHLGDCASRFVRHWSPERVMAEVEAKRRIVREAQHADADSRRYSDPGVGLQADFEQAAHRSDALDDVLRALAAVYADHKDYPLED